MPFGLKNAPATFSRLVAKLLQGLEMFCSAYLDDIIIFSDTWDEHLYHIKQVFDRIRNAGRTLNKRKCEFAAAEFDYLENHVGLCKVEPKRQKVKALLDFPEPSNRKQLQSFLGLFGYYRKYIPHYTTLSCLIRFAQEGNKLLLD